MGLFDKAKDHLSKNPDQTSDYIEKGGDVVDDKTGGQYADHVNKGQDVLQGQFGGPESTQQAREDERDTILKDERLGMDKSDMADKAEHEEDPRGEVGADSRYEDESRNNLP